MKLTLSLLALYCIAPATLADHHGPQSDIVDTAVAAGSFGTLASALQAADLVDALKGEGPFTVFAPTDDAFAKLPAETLKALLFPANKDQLTAVLTYHVVAGSVSAQDAVAAKNAKTLQKDEVRFSIRGGRLTVNDANVVANDVAASNGVIHVIDSVLLPPGGLNLAPQGRLVIGVNTERPSRALCEQLGIERGAALLLTSVSNKSTAQKSGLKKYDVITSIAGAPASDSSLKKAKQEVGFGGRIHMEIIRRGERQTLDVEVGIDRH